MARFINGDSIICADKTINSNNVYIYTCNNWITKSDPTGHVLSEVIGGSVANPYALPFVIIGLGIYLYVSSVENTNVFSLELPEVSSPFDEGNNKNNNHSVYVLADSNMKVQYVGRTSNIENREKQHKQNPNRKDLMMYEVKGGLLYEAARGLEHILIESYGTKIPGNYMNNQINGIGPNNNNMDIYLNAAMTEVDPITLDTETYVGDGNNVYKGK